MSIETQVERVDTTYYIPSLSSALMNGVTTWRNLHNNKEIKTKAEIGYALIASIALVETVVATFFCIATCLLLPFSSRPLKHSYEWLKSSAFCIIWSVASGLLNPFVDKLVEYEGNARGYQGFKFIQS
ncbi:MAG: hypothetical protein Tsb0021_04080 [Chlamydiales bacterium]